MAVDETKEKRGSCECAGPLGGQRWADADDILCNGCAGSWRTFASSRSSCFPGPRLPTEGTGPGDGRVKPAVPLDTTADKPANKVESECEHLYPDVLIDLDDMFVGVLESFDGENCARVFAVSRDSHTRHRRAKPPSSRRDIDESSSDAATAASGAAHRGLDTCSSTASANRRSRASTRSAPAAAPQSGRTATTSERHAMPWATPQSGRTSTARERPSIALSHRPTAPGSKGVSTSSRYCRRRSVGVRAVGATVWSEGLDRFGAAANARCAHR